MDRKTFMKHVDEAFNAEIQTMGDAHETCRHFFDGFLSRLTKLIAPRYVRGLTQEPVATKDNGPMDGIEYTHPAFASISAHRVSGGAVLYGSDFQHQHYVTIKVGPARLKRSLASDWHFAELQNYVEVNLSEAQWAHFVSSMNTGSGTQCTLTDLMGDQIPGLVAPTDRRQQFAAEADERMQRALRSIEEAKEAVKATGLSQKKQEDLLKKMDRARADIGSNLRFVADQFSEHMETTVEHAKAEVEGYMAGATRQLGLQALAAAGGLEAIKPMQLTFPGAPTGDTE